MSGTWRLGTRHNVFKYVLYRIEKFDVDKSLYEYN